MLTENGWPNMISESLAFLGGMNGAAASQAKSNLSRLIQAALNGTEVIIAKGGKSLVRLDVLPQASLKRTVGGQPDLIVHMADDFDASIEDIEPDMR